MSSVARKVGQVLASQAPKNSTSYSTFDVPVTHRNDIADVCAAVEKSRTQKQSALSKLLSDSCFESGRVGSQYTADLRSIWSHLEELRAQSDGKTGTAISNISALVKSAKQSDFPPSSDTHEDKDEGPKAM